MSSKVIRSFNIKPENLEILENNKGIASTSAYLDYVIEQFHSKKGGQ